jgi:hypothetical protein
MAQDPTDKELRGHIKQVLYQLKRHLRAKAAEPGHESLRPAEEDERLVARSEHNK